MNTNLKLTIVLLYILFAIIIASYLGNKPTISFFNNNFKNYDLVLPRYNEDIDWVQKDPFDQFNIICYNKGPSEPFKDIPDNCKVVKLDNVGKCDHTYLYHIINNYDNLAPITLFIPASCYDISWKYDILMKNMKLLNDTNTSVFYGCQFDDVAKDLHNFTIGIYAASGHDKNKELNGHIINVKECSTRPFGKWFEENIGKDLKSTVICYYGILIVDKAHIHNHPKEYYENLIRFVDDDVNPEGGHFMERAWPAIFLPYPDSCKYYRSDGCL